MSLPCWLHLWPAGRSWALALRSARQQQSSPACQHMPTVPYLLSGKLWISLWIKKSCCWTLRSPAAIPTTVRLVQLFAPQNMRMQ